MDAREIILCRPFTMPQVAERGKASNAVVLKQIDDMDDLGHIRTGIGNENIAHQGRFIYAFVELFDNVLDFREVTGSLLINKMTLNEIL